MYIFPLILYHLSVLPLPKDHRVALKQSLFKLLCKGRCLLVHRQICCQRPRDGGLGMPDLESHWLAERLAYLGRSLPKDTAWGLKVRNAFLCLRLNPVTKGFRRPKDEVPFVRECRRAIRNLSRSSDLSRSRKELYRGLVVGSALDRLAGRLGRSLSVELGARLELLDHSEFSLTWRLARNALALIDWAYRASLANMPAAAVVQRQRLCTPSTVESGFARS